MANNIDTSATRTRRSAANRSALGFVAVVALIAGPTLATVSPVASQEMPDARSLDRRPAEGVALADPFTSVFPDFFRGDLLISVTGEVSHHRGAGATLDPLAVAGSSAVLGGCDIDSGAGAFVATRTDGGVAMFDGPEPPHLQTAYGASLSGAPSDIVIAASGHAFVSTIGDDGDVRQFAADGTEIASFDVDFDPPGTVSLDLAADQSTLFSTSGGSTIHRYDVGADAQLPDFADIGGANLAGLALLPGGGLIVAAGENVLELDSAGAPVRSYDVVGDNAWIDVALAPDGTTFWALDVGSNVSRFPIAGPGDAITTSIQLIDVPGPIAGGLCVVGGVRAARADADRDGLLDIWEIDGFDSDGDGDVDVDLPGLGADPSRPDVFIELDWIGGDGVDRSPSAATIERLEDVFAGAPVVDTAGATRGIGLHIIVGQEIPTSVSLASIGSQTGVGDGLCGYDWTEFDSIREANFTEEFRPLMRYVLAAPEVGGGPGCDALQGIARTYDRDPYLNRGASDLIYGLDYLRSDDFDRGNEVFDRAEATVLLHQLGHSLGLGHGGVDLDDDGRRITANHDDAKPNHLSVMNTLFAERGLLVEDSASQVSFSGFTRTDLGALDENDLDEVEGMPSNDPELLDFVTGVLCPFEGDLLEVTLWNAVGSIDWNCNGSIDDAAVSMNLSGFSELETLETSREWRHLVYRGGSIGVVSPNDDRPESSVPVTREPGHADSALYGPLNPPEAVDDAYATEDGLEAPAPGVLSNDRFFAAAVPEERSTSQGGRVSINSDGSFTYSPPSGFTGTDTFRYRAASVNGIASATATLTVTAGTATTVTTTAPTSTTAPAGGGAAGGGTLPVTGAGAGLAAFLFIGMLATGTGGAVARVARSALRRAIRIAVPSRAGLATAQKHLGPALDEAKKSQRP